MPFGKKKPTKRHGSAGDEETSVTPESSYTRERRSSEPTLKLPQKRRERTSFQLFRRGSDACCQTNLATRDLPPTPPTIEESPEDLGRTSNCPLPQSFSSSYLEGHFRHHLEGHLSNHNQRLADHDQLNPTNRIIPNRNHRDSETSDLPPSPRYSDDLTKSADFPSSGLRDSGLGQEMAESEVRIKLVNDIVQVLKQNIDDHFDDLVEELRKRKELLKVQLESHMTKTCQDINEGRSQNQKVEFHPQDDMGLGVIIFTDEDNTRDQFDGKSDSEEPDYVNMSSGYMNIPNGLPNTNDNTMNPSNSAGSESQDTYEVFNLPTSQDLPKSRFANESRTPDFSAPVPAPHATATNKAHHGYINMHNVNQRPVPPPRPNWRK